MSPRLSWPGSPCCAESLRERSPAQVKAQSSKLKAQTLPPPRPAPGTLNLELSLRRSYFRRMKRPLSLLLVALCSGELLFPSLAQDSTANRAAAIAERDAAEERYKRLSSAVDDLWNAKGEQDRRLAALTEEIRNLRAESSRPETSKYVTRDELNKLVKTVEEIERKREADKKLILEQFEELKRDLKSDLRKMLSAPPPSTSPKSTKQS